MKVVKENHVQTFIFQCRFMVLFSALFSNIVTQYILQKHEANHAMNVKRHALLGNHILIVNSRGSHNFQTDKCLISIKYVMLQ